MKLRWLVVALVALAIVPLAACRRSETPAPSPEPTSNSQPTSVPEPPAMQQIRVYLVRGEKIGVIGSEVEKSADTEAVAQGAVQELLRAGTSGEDNAGLTTAIPTGTKLIGLRLAEDGVATIDLSDEFGSGGGSLSMQLRVAQVVYTLTQFAEVKKVAFELNGEPAQAIGGEGVVVDPPVDRSDFENVTPPILVEGPVPGQQLVSPFEAYGTSNVFEATHRLEVIDAGGRPVASTQVVASSGTGTRGVWRQRVEFFTDTPGPGKFRAFVLSAKDGSEEDVIEFPVFVSK